jgi:Domain of unknown function (DUF4912)
MAPEDSTNTAQRAKKAGFQISGGPVIREGEADLGAFASEFGELPRAYGAPILFAIPRDPRTLFTYWSIDWSTVFATNAPAERQVFLRVKKADGGDESESVIEPMLGSFYAPVSQPRENYRVELGYYLPTDTWHSVATSEAVTMPAEDASENVAVDVATVPFHLSFQRMIDLFRSSNGGTLTDIISRLQNRALTDEERALLTPEELEILDAMNLSMAEMDEARRAYSDHAASDRLRKRAEAILGFGSTSPAGGFGGSSWS